MTWTTEEERRTRQRYYPTPRRYGVQEVKGDYVSVREVAGRLGITKQGVRARIRKGLLPAMKLADMWMIKRSDVCQSWTV